MKNLSSYRAEAREALSGRWTDAAVASLIVGLIVLLLASPYGFISVGFSENIGLLAGGNIYYWLLIIFLTMPLSYAFTFAFLRVRRANVEGDSILRIIYDVFTKHYERALTSSLWVMLAVLGLSMLAAIGAFIIALVALVAIAGADAADYAASENGVVMIVAVVMGSMLLLMIPLYVYSYAVSLYAYVTEENPELTVHECVKKSREMMRGHKWQLFCLDLSFIGWAMLAILTCGIGMLWLTPYILTARAAFYEDVRREYVGDTEPVETEPEPEVKSEIEIIKE